MREIEGLSIAQLIAVLAHQQECYRLLRLKAAREGYLYIPIETEMDIEATEQAMSELDPNAQYPSVVADDEFSRIATPEAFMHEFPKSVKTSEALLANKQERLYALRQRQVIFGSQLPTVMELQIRALERRIYAIKLELHQRNPETYLLPIATIPPLDSDPRIESVLAEPRNQSTNPRMFFFICFLILLMFALKFLFG